MSDIENIKADLNSADLEPIVEGVNKIASYVLENKKAVDTKVADLEKNVGRKLTDIDEKVEKGIHDVLDRVEDLSKRTSISGRFNFDQDDTSAMKAAIPERFRKNWSAYEMAASQNGKKPSYEEVVKFAIQDVYYKNASKIGLKSFSAERTALETELFGFVDQLNKINKADMNEGGTGTGGGYSVPTIVANEVLKIVRDASLIYSRARQIPMTSNVLNFPDENTAVTTNWVLEAGALTQGEPVFGVKTLTAKKLVGRAVFSLELLDDSNVAIVPFLQSCFAEKMGGELDFQAMEGPGTVFTGVMFAASVNNAGATNTTNGVVLKYQTTAAQTTIASLVRIYGKAGEGMTRKDGIWVCGPQIYTQILGLTDSNGQPIVRLGTVEGQPNDTIFGRPIVVSNRLTVYTVGAGPISVGSLYFGPPSGLLFGSRQGMRWDVTDQVHWGNYQADARLVGRFGFVTGVPNAWTMQKDIQV